MNMAPQGYPIRVVRWDEDGADEGLSARTPLLVLGWVDSNDGIAPVVAGLTRGVEVWPADAHWSLYETRAEAESDTSNE